MKKNKKMLQVKLVRSLIGCCQRHRLSVKALGLRGIGHTVQVQDHPAVRGLIRKVSYLVAVEDI